MKKDSVSTLKLAATYIGVIVGAGFATGQEVLQFFTRFGVMGIVGLILSTVLFIIFGFIVMDLGKKLKARSHLELIEYSGGKVLGAFFDILITFFLFGTLAAMIAGTGALFQQQLYLPGLLGNLLMCVLTAVTVMSGMKGIVNSISFVVPFLLISVIGISLFSIVSTPPELIEPVRNAEGNGFIMNWFLSCVLYVSYNTIISIAVLGPLGVQAKNIKTIQMGAILGGLGLGTASVMIYLALSGNYAEINGLEVPMIYIAGQISPVMQLIYAVILAAEIYTTAVGSLYGFVSRVTVRKKNLFTQKTIVITVTIAALMASQLGFSNLVKYLYPLVGYGGILLLVSLICIPFRNRTVFMK